MTQLTQTPAQLPPMPAGSDDFRAQITAASAAARSAFIARLAERLEQARYEARSLVAKTG